MVEAVNMTFEVGKGVGCDASTSTELVACLRKKPVEDFITLYEESVSLFGGYYVRPVADGQFLLDDPFKMSSEGSFNPADVMIGCLENEGALFVMPGLNGQEGNERPVFNYSTYRELIGMNVRVQDQFTIDMTAYVFSTPEQLDGLDADYASSVITLLGDTMFLCPTFNMAEQLAKAGRNVYTYLMTHVPSQSIFGKDYKWFGATHGEDIAYVLGTPLVAQHDMDDESDFAMIGSFKDDGEVQLSLQIMEYWTNFAKTGNPNLSSNDDVVPPVSKYPLWPRFTTLEPAYKDLSLSLENRQGKANAKECHYLEKLLPSLLKNAADVTHLRSLLQEKVDADSEKVCQDPTSCPGN